jgi:hypothetical protein
MTSHARGHSGTEAAAAAATSHLGDPSTVHGGVGLVVLGSQPGPRRQLRGLGEATDVADLGDEHRGQHRSDPRNGLDGEVAGVGAQPTGYQLAEQLDLKVEVLDQPQRRVDPGPRLGGQPRRGE